MEALKDLGQKKQGNRNYRFGLFKCLYCNEIVEKIYKDGVKAKACSHKCYALNREKRGAYKEKIIINKYCYIYMPSHPKAMGTKKLYVAEHRLIMELYLGRYLTNNEIVHHINKDTLCNNILNLKLMSAVEHIKHHTLEKKRAKDGKFSI